MSIYAYTSLGADIPAAPLIQVRLSSPEEKPSVTLSCTAFLDSGADCTLVPFDLLIKVNAVIAGSKETILGTSKGNAIVIPYFVNLSFDRFVYQTVRVRGCPSEDIGGIILIGRDLINNFVLELNGPQLIYKIL